MHRPLAGGLSVTLRMTMRLPRLPHLFGRCGWLYTWYHRARYGWAPRDCWSLDDYLGKVLVGSLRHLANVTHGYPIDFPGGQAGWESQLHTWADAFDFDQWDINVMMDQEKLESLWEKRKQALIEMAPWWGALWD
jgi:hypothetical protein